jgi:hypothetical protein
VRWRWAVGQWYGSCIVVPINKATLSLVFVHTGYCYLKGFRWEAWKGAKDVKDLVVV